MEITIISVLIISGIIVGFVNTFAGGGSALSLPIYMLLGLPPNVANGTNRVSVMFQNLTSVLVFKKNKVLDVKNDKSLIFPTIIGAIIGSFFATEIDGNLFKKIVGFVLLLMFILVVFKPNRWFKIKSKLNYKTKFLQNIIYFLIGIYGGAIQVGVGYLILAGLVLYSGLDIIKANAIKVYIILVYTIFVLAIFLINNQISLKFGLIHSLGNIIGSFFAANYASNFGKKFINIFVSVMTLFLSLYLLGVIDLEPLILKLIK